jgi:hypothetical protein
MELKVYETVREEMFCEDVGADVGDTGHSE